MFADKYVGLDVHKATTVVMVLDASGELVQQTILPTQTAVLRDYFSGLTGSVQVAFEEGVQSAWLFDLLSPLVSRVVVANPRKTSRGKHEQKTDEVDALRLARLLRSGELPSVYHGEHGTRSLKQLARHYAALVDDSTSLMNRVKAIFRSLAIDCPGQGVYSPHQRQLWLARLENDGTRFRCSALLEQLDTVRDLRERAKRELVREGRKHPAFARLCGLPGFGPVRVAVLVAILDTPHRFRTAHNLWAYAGLAVVVHETSQYRVEGGKVVKARQQVRTRGLNKNGNRRLKHLLKSAAASACWREPMKSWYEQRLACGMRKELAQVSLARKLGAMALAMWKSGETFDERKITGGKA